MRRRTIAVALLVFAPALSHACLNDRDTLADEAQRFPDAVQVITGRFPRNPPLYYQMRIDREGADLKAHPNNLAEYDDVAVALDRIGRDDEALAVMARKLLHMKSLNTPGNADNSGDTPWYRYDANTGTFLAHRYIRHPGKYPDSDLQRGRDLIAEAIRVNPHAHFGREKVQLAVMDWMLDAWADGRLGSYLIARLSRRDLEKGLEGLVVLGGAWESPDIFGAMSEVYFRDHQREMGIFAGSRGAELLKDGARPLKAEVYRDVAEARPGGPAWSTDANFQRLRKEAEAWHARRTAYMMERLTAGRHPDTDPTFWADWHDAGPPPLVDKLWLLKTVHHTGIEWWQILGYLAFVGLAFVACVRRWRQVGMKWDEAVLAVAFGIIFTALVFGAMA
jgi:hypothetical protein